MRAIVVIGLAFLGSSAFAQEGIYVGLGIGNFDYAEDSAFLAPAPFADTVSSWKIYGGFEFNDNFAFEIRYGATDEIRQDFSGTDPLSGDFAARFDTDFTTTSVAAMGVLPMEWGALFGGIGYFDTDAKTNLELTTDCCEPASGEISIGDDGAMAVLGIEWRLFDRFGMGVGIRIEYEWLDADNADASTIGIGAAYRF